MINPDAYPCEETPRSEKQTKNLPVLCNITSRHRSRQCCSLNGSTNASSLKSRNIFEKEGLPVNVLLIIDNAPGHPKSINIEDENVQVVFLPLNTTSLLQSLDQSIIRCVKASYTRQVFDMIRAAIDADPKVQVIGG